MSTSYHPQQLLTPKQAAEILGAAEKTLEGWRTKGGGPHFIKQGTRFIRYRMEDLSDWVESKRVCSTAQYEEKWVEPKPYPLHHQPFGGNGSRP